MRLIAETRIKGAFKGCNGRHVYRLANGEAWKESRYTYSYHYAYDPAAKIWHDGSAYYLEVDGMSELIQVKKATSGDIEEAEQNGD